MSVCPSVCPSVSPTMRFFFNIPTASPLHSLLCQRILCQWRVPAWWRTIDRKTDGRRLWFPCRGGYWPQSSVEIWVLHVPRRVWTLACRKEGKIWRETIARDGIYSVVDSCWKERKKRQERKPPSYLRTAYSPERISEFSCDSYWIASAYGAHRRAGADVHGASSS